MRASQIMRQSQGLLGRKWPTPILRPVGPFFVAGAIVFYGIWNIESAMIKTDQWKNDPRNPERFAQKH